MKYYIGIDNGLTGGITCIDPNGKVYYTYHMPLRTSPVTGKKEVDPHRMLTILEGFGNLARNTGTDTVFVVERSCGSQGINPAVSMAVSFKTITLLLELKSFRFVPVKPQEWQHAIFGKNGIKDTKGAALTKARQLWPDFRWPTLTPSGQKLHDGIIDAALIAEYGRLKNL